MQRRFVLGMQGLWPGRRWRGIEGARSALLEGRGVRVDPLDVVGRSQDLAFLSRVVDYRREDLDRLLYEERVGFEHGGAVSIYPREQLGLHYSWVRNEGLPVRWERWYRENADAVKRVRREVEKRGPLDASEWADGDRVDNYRSSRTEGVALYYLWRSLEVMIHHRKGNRKFYDLTERMFGSMPEPVSKDSTVDEMAYQTMGWLGLSGQEGIRRLRTNEDGRGRSKVTKLEIRQRLVDEGRLAEVQVDGERRSAVLWSDKMGLLEEVAAGEVPRAWKSIVAEPEAIFLAPLDITIAGERSMSLFGFEYLWEVYKPASKRRWGYYVLPVLYGDGIVGRIEPIYAKEDGCLRIAKAWWDEGTDVSRMAEPLARGIDRLAGFLGARRVVIENAGSPKLTNAVRQKISSRP